MPRQLRFHIARKDSEDILVLHGSYYTAEERDVSIKKHRTSYPNYTWGAFEAKTYEDAVSRIKAQNKRTRAKNKSSNE